MKGKSNGEVGDSLIWWRKSITLLEGSHASPARPSDINSINVKVKVKNQ